MAVYDEKGNIITSLESIENNLFTYNEDGNIVVNYGLNEDGTFNFYQIYPIEDNLPKLVVSSPEILHTIKLGVTKLVNGKIVNPEPKPLTDEEIVELIRRDFKIYREGAFKAFDIYKSNVVYGIISETESIRQKIINWYQEMLDFTTLITKNTTRDDYPEIPDKIKKYLGI